MSTFTVTTPDSSTPLATFRVPLKCWANVPITFSPSPNTPDAQSTLSLNRTNWGQLLTGCNHAFVRNSETFEWVFVSGTEIALRDKHSRTLVKFYHAPSWFQSGGVLAIGEDWQGKGTENHEQKQQQREWEQVVVVTLFAFLRKEREWRYAMAGLVFPIKRGALAKKKTTIWERKERNPSPRSIYPMNDPIFRFALFQSLLRINKQIPLTTSSTTRMNAVNEN